MEKINFVKYVVDKLGLEEDKYLLERTFENLVFDDSEFDFGPTNNNEHYAYIRVLASLDENETFDDKVVINIGKDPNLHKTLVKLCFTYNGKLHVLFVSADENEIKMQEKSNTLWCNGMIFSESATERLNSRYINDTASETERFDLQHLEHIDIEPERSQQCDYDRNGDMNIINAALTRIKEMDDFTRPPMKYIEENGSVKRVYEVHYDKEKLKELLDRIIKTASYREEGTHIIPAGPEYENNIFKGGKEPRLSNGDPTFENIKSIREYTSTDTYSFHGDSIEIEGTKVVPPLLEYIIRNILKGDENGINDLMNYQNYPELIDIDVKINDANKKVDEINNFSILMLSYYKHYMMKHFLYLN